MFFVKLFAFICGS